MSAKTASNLLKNVPKFSLSEKALDEIEKLIADRK